MRDRLEKLAWENSPETLTLQEMADGVRWRGPCNVGSRQRYQRGGSEDGEKVNGVSFDFVVKGLGESCPP